MPVVDIRPITETTIETTDIPRIVPASEAVKRVVVRTNTGNTQAFTSVTDMDSRTTLLQAITAIQCTQAIMEMKVIEIMKVTATATLDSTVVTADTDIQITVTDIRKTGVITKAAGTNTIGAMQATVASTSPGIPISHTEVTQNIGDIAVTTAATVTTVTQDPADMPATADDTLAIIPASVTIITIMRDIAAATVTPVIQDSEATTAITRRIMAVSIVRNIGGTEQTRDAVVATSNIPLIVSIPIMDSPMIVATDMPPTIHSTMLRLRIPSMLINQQVSVMTGHMRSAVRTLAAYLPQTESWSIPIKIRTVS
jgi:hypothetical protein